MARCAGTCHTSEGVYQRCMADSVATTQVQVMMEQVVPGEQARVREVCGWQEVQVHTSCRCGCEELQCGPLQQFNNRTCECRCTDIGARGQCLVQYNKVTAQHHPEHCQHHHCDQVWDADQCKCMCSPEVYQECNTGFTYDGVYTCQCLPVSKYLFRSTLQSPSLLEFSGSFNSAVGGDKRPYNRVLHFYCCVLYHVPESKEKTERRNIIERKN